MKIVIDTMGGDNGSNATVGGILKFLESHKDVEIIAVGDEKELEPLKDKCKIKQYESYFLGHYCPIKVS